MYETIHQLQEEIGNIRARKEDVYQMIAKERKEKGYSTILDNVYLELDKTLIDKEQQLTSERAGVQFRPDTLQTLYARLETIQKNKDIYPVVDNLITELNNLKDKAHKAAKDIEGLSRKDEQNFKEYVKDIKYYTDNNINYLINLLKRIPEYQRDIKGIEQGIKSETKRREDLKRSAAEERDIKESLMKY